MEAKDQENNMDQKRDELVNKVKSFFSKENSEKTSNEDEASSSEEREKLLNFLKEKTSWWSYLVLAIIIYIGVFIRTRNLNLLKDITTGKFVPLALDPHLFTKYAKEIAETGTLAVIDTSRYVPLGVNTVDWFTMSYFISLVHKVLSIFNPNVTIEYAAIVYPVICFSVALLFFFLVVRRMFDTKLALLSTFFLAIIPAFLQRTMMGFADHEAFAIMFMFAAMYVFIVAWQSKSTKHAVGFGLLSGILTGIMGLTWGGYKFLVLLLALFSLALLFLDTLKERDTYQYFAWLIGFTPVVTLLVPVFSLKQILLSVTTGFAFLVAFILLVDLIVFKKKMFGIKEKISKFTKKLPDSMVSLIGTLALVLILGGIFAGPTLIEKSGEIVDNFLHPLGNDRWELTVAEQSQPYFTDWISQFGPSLLRSGSFGGFPIYLILFMLGSVLLFYSMVKENKQKWQLTGAYTAFILAFSMSRFSKESVTFNGQSTLSILVYLGSLALFMVYLAWFYFREYNKDKENYKQILSWDKDIIFVLIWFVIMVVAARGASRLFFIFAPITAVMASYTIVYFGEKIFSIKNASYKYVSLFVLAFILLSPFAAPFQGVVPTYYKASLNQGTYSGPGYNQQWQVTGEWVRNNVAEDAVFAHWWDYGYWVQNGWERATVLDGTNRNRFWNYLMGRHVLGGQTQEEALEFLDAHDTTHMLIVADEIGKYTAYSSIGSDENFDRFSWITTFSLDPQQTRETRDTTLYTYSGGYLLDDDFVWEGTVYPRQQAGIGAVFVPMREIQQQVGDEMISGIEFEQPYIAMVYRGQRADIPLECIYFNEQMIWFQEEKGYSGCLRILPTLNGDGSLNNMFGAGLFVSEEGVKALWTNLYLFDQKNPRFDTSAFELVYGGDNNPPLSIYQGRVIGPQKIWQINYPEGFTVDPETEARYIGGNELLPDYFYDVN